MEERTDMTGRCEKLKRNCGKRGRGALTAAEPVQFCDQVGEVEGSRNGS
jgi:hypothetical protein